MRRLRSAFVGRTLHSAQRPQRADQRKPRATTAAGNAINESNQPYNIFNYGTEPYSVRFLSQSLSFFPFADRWDRRHCALTLLTPAQQHHAGSTRDGAGTTALRSHWRHATNTRISAARPVPRVGVHEIAVGVSITGLGWVLARRDLFCGSVVRRSRRPRQKFVLRYGVRCRPLSNRSHTHRHSSRRSLACA